MKACYCTRFADMQMICVLALGNKELRTDHLHTPRIMGGRTSELRQRKVIYQINAGPDTWIDSSTLTSEQWKCSAAGSTQAACPAGEFPLGMTTFACGANCNSPCSTTQYESRAKSIHVPHCLAGIVGTWRRSWRLDWTTRRFRSVQCKLDTTTSFQRQASHDSTTNHRSRYNSVANEVFVDFLIFLSAWHRADPSRMDSTNRHQRSWCNRTLSAPLLPVTSTHCRHPC